MRHQAKSHRLGATTVEFALVLPILLLMVTAGIELTRLSLLNHLTETAADEAARRVIVPGATSEEATARANEVLALVGVRGAVVTVNPATIGEATSRVAVTVSVPADANQWIFPKLSSGAVTRSEISMLTERAPIFQINSVPAPPPIPSDPPPPYEPPPYEPPPYEPPPYEPPSYEPPAYEPPAYEPPAYEPPAYEPPSYEPPPPAPVGL